MQKKFFFASLVLLVSISLTSAATQGRGGIYFGQKSLNSSDWSSLDQQDALGFDLDVKGETWPVWITAGYVASKDETTVTSLSPLATHSIEGKTSEYRLGVKKDFLPMNRMRLSFAGGPAFIHAKMDRASAPFDSDSDSGAGYWAGADAFLSLGYIIVGLGYHYSQANMDLLDRSIDAGGENFAFSIGMGW